MAFLVGLFLLCVGSVFADPFTYLGDLPLENPDLFGGDILLQDPEDRNAIVNNLQIWPGGVVPYEEDPGLKKTVSATRTWAEWEVSSRCPWVRVAAGKAPSSTSWDTPSDSITNRTDRTEMTTLKSIGTTS
ncbi:unnamed protein product [Larinioides sclopetarius]|uniref:Uncharacterized protein n=1 Tax=Larinioides sclopetarius TaxID=280406 RepID=A0AAV1ZJA4_9ARAC